MVNKETKDLLMMEWVLDQFIRQYIHEYKTQRLSEKLQSDAVDPSRRC
jgi:hypothetical protein